MWKRVIAPVVLVSILWMSVSILTTYHVNRLFEAGSRTLSEDVTTIEASWSMRRDTWKLQVAILETAYANREQMQREISQLETSFFNSLAEAERTSLTPEEQTAVQTIRERFGVYRAYIQDHLQARSAGANVASPTDRERALSLASGVSEACRALSDLNDQLIDAAATQSRRLHATVIIVRIGFLIFGPLVGLLLGLIVARRLNRSISQISVTLNDASGKLSRDLGSVAVSVSAELPALQRQVQVFGDRIRDVVEKLDEARQRAVQSERLAAVGELAAGVAHEIRNPLTSVKLLIQNAAQRHPSHGLNEKQSQVVLQEIARMETMIQELLDFARPPRLRVVSHDLRQTIKRALNLVEGRAEQEKVRIIQELPATPLVVSGDPEQLHLVFVNLAINGVEAMIGGGTLKVSASLDDHVCRVMFSDSGSGISPQLKDRLFEPFVTDKEGGTGLGLAISRRIVHEHGGLLIAANREEGGALFTVELQLGEVHLAGDETGQVVQPQPVTV